MREVIETTTWYRSLSKGEPFFLVKKSISHTSKGGSCKTPAALPPSGGLEESSVAQTNDSTCGRVLGKEKERSADVYVSQSAYLSHDEPIPQEPLTVT